ncbi:hypothetical protein BN946_scf184703.g2 [Trametes cinnabarina]|uniref:Uncharacterized protein n=1 Tax=Pycnoporus cinnabarinus TaxID=5643 RepID=A0A060SKN0_PYCCI|nr:hypothetical protein BN946_scf184703.g2 [Trametes cinnabarina]
MRRFLAFANRDRASGSSLPALLAHLNSAVEAADDADTEVTDLLVSGIAGALREGEFIMTNMGASRSSPHMRPWSERETKAAVARFLEEDIRNAVTAVNYVNNDPDHPTPKEYALRDRLQQLSAYKRTGKQRLDTTATQGMTLEKLVREKKVSKSLSRKLFKYICERE